MNSSKDNEFPRPLLHKGILEKNQQPVWVIITGASGVLSSWALVDVNTKANEIRIVLPNLKVFITPLANNSHRMFAGMGILIFEKPVRPNENPLVAYS